MKTLNQVVDTRKHLGTAAAVGKSDALSIWRDLTRRGHDGELMPVKLCLSRRNPIDPGPTIAS